jgi:N-acetylglucosamine-6-phosphate deacetylase
MIIGSLSVCCLLLLLAPDSRLAAGDGTMKIEGIFYLDYQPVSVEIQDGKIERLTRLEKLTDLRNEKLFLAPGFIDNQVNGYLSYSFTRPELTVEKVRIVTKGFWQKGITTYVPTLTTESRERLLENFGILNEAIGDKEISLSVPGFHLEGPYISPVDGFRGAHPAEWVRPPDWEEFLALYQASGKHIIEVSVAPELAGAIDFIRRLRSLGIIVALAHHNGTAAQIKEAVDAGAVLSTHLGNGCANMIHRHDNPLWPQLADPRLTASLIVDGFHLTREEVRVFTKTKGPERTILVSDLSSLAGMPPGEYERFGSKVVVHPSGMITLPSQNVLAAASFLITKGVENMMAFTGCSLAEAVDMATRNPARLMALNDRGEIIPGKRADLVLFTLDNGKMDIKKTYLAGELVYDAEDKGKR